uniref:protein RRP6-like 1 n=1 Tax=Erigeron canadensis TaxID=72917 RepID=UPI001CB940B4|nr:protein RRP6-like 1 [Erigeron canadensis]
MMISSSIQETHTHNLPLDYSDYFSGFPCNNKPCSSYKDLTFFQDFINPVQESYKKSQYVVGCDNIWANNLQNDYFGNFKDFEYPPYVFQTTNCVYDNTTQLFPNNYLDNHEAYKYWLANHINYNHGGSGDQFVRRDKEKFINHQDLAVDQNKVDDDNNGTQKVKMPYHIGSIPKPQDEYKIVVNNVNQPFEHVWLQRSEDGSRLIHPLEKFSVFHFIDRNVSKLKPVKPPPVETMPFKFVQEEKDLRELVHKLRVVNEFAVDLEHNQYRSYQGLTCLMQISTRTEDFIVDTLKLQAHIGPYLRDLFRDPTKRKVMHGADKDILWLQRDFGIYVCNMFDTGQASRVLKMERNSLEYLLLYFCGVPLNKEYQRADWRLRPLTNEMLRYAREDTHYLLHLYDLMKRRLLSSSTDPKYPEALLVEVYQRSYDVCIQLYQKEVVDQYSYLSIYGLHAADLSAEQLSVVAALCEWRDIVARAEDESTGYVLSNKCLIEIAKQMPTTIGELRNLLKVWNPPIERRFDLIINIVQISRRNAAAFEAVARKLKQECMEIEASQITKKMPEEASSMSIGGNNIVMNQSGNAVEKRKLGLDTMAPMNIKFGTFSTEPGSLLQTMKEPANARKVPDLKEPNATCSKPLNSVVVQKTVSTAMVEKGGRVGAANEGEKTLSNLSSTFQKCLQTTKDQNFTSQARDC